MFDPRQVLRSHQRQKLSILVFLIIFGLPLGIIGWLAPDLVDASFLPILLLALLGAYASWSWSRDNL